MRCRNCCAEICDNVLFCPFCGIRMTKKDYDSIETPYYPLGKQAQSQPRSVSKSSMALSILALVLSIMAFLLLVWGLLLAAFSLTLIGKVEADENASKVTKAAKIIVIIEIVLSVIYVIWFLFAFTSRRY